MLDQRTSREAEAAAGLSVPTSVRDLVFILFKWKWSLFGVVAVGLCGAVVWLWVIRDPAYELTAKVLVKIGYEQAPPATNLTDRVTPVIGERLQDINTEVDILQNTELIAQLVDRLQLDVPAPPVPYPDGFVARARWHVRDTMTRFKEWQNDVLIGLGLRPQLTRRESVIAMLKDGLLVLPQPDSNVIAAHMFVPVREGSSVILNTLLDLYLSYRLKVWKGEGAVEFFEANVLETERQLREAEEALRQFDEAWDVPALNHQRQVLQLAISDARAEARDAEIAYREAAGREERLLRELTAPEPVFATVGAFEQGSFPETLLTQLSQLRREREQLRLTELDGSRRLQNNQAQFDLVLAQVAAHVRAIVADRQRVYEARAAALAALETQLREVPAKETERHALQRRASEIEEAYLMYREKQRETDAIAQLESQRIGNVVIIERATDPLRPAGTRKLTLLAASAAVILFVALAWVAVAEFFDHRIYSAEALERELGVPVIGVVPAARRAVFKDPPAATTGLLGALRA
jgi:uncharacterized protein involved in exopolysaccharide biosynthesis